MKLNDFVTHFPALKPNVCQELIDVYENSIMAQLRHDNAVQHFSEVNLNQQDPELAQRLVPVITGAVQSYTDFTVPAGDRYFQASYGLEEMRIKRYDKGDCFNQHVDVGSLASSKRFLAFLFYLNDDYQGGKTVFKTPDTLTISPLTGNVVMFPPTWQYPHAGMPVLSGTKYIMSTYLNYV